MYKDEAGGEIIDEFVGFKEKLYSYKMLEGEESKKYKGVEKYAVNPFPHNDSFWCPWETSLFENTVGKGEIARNKQFLLYPQCFLPV